MKRLQLVVLFLFVSAFALTTALKPNVVKGQGGAQEAPAGFDNQTNGFESQGTDPTVTGTFVGDKAIFEKRDTVATGLGPVYNAQSCAECHQNSVTGGVSQILEIRAGHSGPGGTFVPAPSGSLIQTRAINPQIPERVPDRPRIASQNSSWHHSLM